MVPALSSTTQRLGLSPRTFASTHTDSSTVVPRSLLLVVRTLPLIIRLCGDSTGPLLLESAQIVSTAPNLVCNVVSARLLIKRTWFPYNEVPLAFESWLRCARLDLTRHLLRIALEFFSPTNCGNYLSASQKKFMKTFHWKALKRIQLINAGAHFHRDRRKLKHKWK